MELLLESAHIVCGRLSLFEVIQLRAAFGYHYYEQFRCEDTWEAKRNPPNGRPWTEQQITQAKMDKGCIRDSRGKFRGTIPLIDGVEIEGCLCRMRLADDAFNLIHQQWKTWKDKAMAPYGENPMEMPVKTYEIFNLLDTWYSDWERDMEEERKAKAKQK